MRFLHTMIRVKDLDVSLDFYCHKLGLVESHRIESEVGRFTLVYLYAPGNAVLEVPDSHWRWVYMYEADLAEGEQAKKIDSPLLELTYNWDTEDYTGGRNFGHLAFEVDNIYATCEWLIEQEITINRPPRDGYMAFIKSPDGISIELLQKGKKLEPMEPWISMQNVGSW